MSIGSWIENVLISRYAKSAIRYLLVAGATWLQLKGQYIPELHTVADLINTNLPVLIDALTAVILFLVAGWSVSKNTKNRNISLTTK